MKTTVIKLEPYDDIISARDKMSWCRSARILLVFPGAFTVLDRKLDLMLLIRHSQELGAQLAIVCDDPEIRANAREAGIPNFLSASVAQKSAWRRTRFRRMFSEQKSFHLQLPELQSKARTRTARIWQNHRLRLAVFLTGILAVFVLVWFFIPSAHIYLPDIQSKQTIVVSVWASPVISYALPSGGLPVSVVSVVVESQEQAASTGLAVVPDKAAIGHVQFTNLTSQTVMVPAGAVVLAPGSTGVRFEVLQEITVPASGWTVAFSPVQAVLPGSAGNVAAGEIRAIEGDLGLQLYVINLNPTLHGEDRKAASPTKLDYETLRTEVLKGLNGKAMQEIELKFPSGEKILPPSLKLVNILEERREPEVGLPSDQIKLTIRAEFSAWYIHLQDLANVERIALDADLSDGMTGINDSLRSDDINDPQVVNETIQWQVQASRDVQKIWDKEAVASLVLGKRPDDAARLMTKMLGIPSGLRIEVNPGWWPFLPSLLFRVEVGNE